MTNNAKPDIKWPTPTKTSERIINIAKKLQATLDEATREYYEDHPPQFYPPEIHVHVIDHFHEMTKKAVNRYIERKETLDDLIAAYASDHYEMMAYLSAQILMYTQNKMDLDNIMPTNEQNVCSEEHPENKKN